MQQSLSNDDYSHLASLQLDRLRALFPSELQDATLTTQADASLVVGCDWETIALLNEDSATFMHFVYITTGCDRALFFVDDVRVMEQERAIELQASASREERVMAVAERTAKQTAALQTMTAAAEDAVAAKPRRSINEIVQELADEIALRAIARVEASAVMVNTAIREHANGNTPEQPPELEAIPATPAKLPTVRLKAIYSPTASNFVQSAKRYLKATDLKEGTAALKAIVDRTPTGLAHIQRAVRAYPVDQQDKAREKLPEAFLKIHTDRTAQA